MGLKVLELFGGVGACRLCGKTIDSKAKFEYEMVCRLKLWRSKSNKKVERCKEVRKEYRER